MLLENELVKDSFWEGIIKEADKNNDGEIDYSEFIEMMDKMKMWSHLIWCEINKNKLK